jgi:hypothetical protein
MSNLKEVDKQLFDKWKRTKILSAKIKDSIQELAVIDAEAAFGCIEFMRNQLLLAWFTQGILKVEKKSNTEDIRQAAEAQSSFIKD